MTAIEVVEIDDAAVALRSPRTGDVYGVAFNFVGGKEEVRLDLLHRGDESCEHCLTGPETRGRRHG